jgi:predicted nucleic acid-binding protein
MRVLIDTNIVLDFLQEREPFVDNAARLFNRVDAGDIEGFIAATTITNIVISHSNKGGLMRQPPALQDYPGERAGGEHPDEAMNSQRWSTAFLP